MIELGHPWTADGQRQVFRLLLAAWSRPGVPVALGAWCGGSRAHLAVLAALCDAATTFHDLHGLLGAGDRSRLGARPAAAGAAAFLLADAARSPAGLAPCRGDLLAPEHGATIVLDCRSVGEGAEVRLTGPGVDGTAGLRALGVDPHWWRARAGWCAPPVGVDLVLCDGDRVVCAPRSSIVEF